MKHSLVITILFIFCVCCKRSPSLRGEEYLSYPLDSPALYFPAKNINPHHFDKRERTLDAISNEFSSEELSAAKEPLLFDYYGSLEIYRLSYSRSFHQPLVIRVQKQRDRIQLIVKNLKRAAGSLTLQETSSIIITKSDWQTFLSLLKKADFWTYPTMEKHPREWSTDGATWIFEGVKNGEYHFIVTKGPAEGLWKVGEYLLLLSKLNIPPEDIY